MKIVLIGVVVLLAAATAFSAEQCPGQAAPPKGCTCWLLQKTGLYWRECVNDKGVQTCQLANDATGKGARIVSCGK